MKLRYFLKKNEIYFTTITSVLVAIMAIIVSINANGIAKEQSNINYFENTPDFQLTREFLRDTLGNVNEMAIRVAKFGGKAKNIDVKVKSFARIELVDKENEKIEKYVHLFNYFNESYRTGENEGNIRLLKGINNKKYFTEFENILESALGDKGYLGVYIDEVVVVKISFTNFMKDQQSEYYDISLSDGVLLEKTDFKVDLFNLEDRELTNISITDLSSEEVRDYVIDIIH